MSLRKPAVGRPRGRWIGVLALLAAAATVVATIAANGRPAATGPGAGTTASGAATVQRRNLVATDTESGTLSYADSQTVYNRLSGTITWVPQIGQVIKPGQTLFEVDNKPVLLMNGSTPAYRALTASDVSGPDVYELNRNLVALGYNPDGIVVDDKWQYATTAGIERMQYDLGEAETGQLALGEVVFLPGAQMVQTVDTTVGSTAAGYAGAARRPLFVDYSRDSPGAGTGTGTGTAAAGTGTTATGTGTGTTAAGTGTGTTGTTTSGAGTTSTTDTTGATGEPGAGTTTGATTPTRTSTTAPARTPTSPAGSKPSTTMSGGDSLSRRTLRALLRLIAEQQRALQAEQRAANHSPSAGSGGPSSGSHSPSSGSHSPSSGSHNPSSSSHNPSSSSHNPSSSSHNPSSGSRSPSSNPGNGGGGSAVAVLATSSTKLVVTVDLSASSQAEATVGEQVTVQMPNGSTVGGRVSAVSPVAQSSSSGDNGSGGNGNGGGNGGSGGASTVPVTIVLDRPAHGGGLDQASVSVEFVKSRARHVLSVPVTALLATSGSAFAVEQATAPHHLIPVRTGLFAAGYVAISGAGIHPGLKVTDSQG